MVPFLIKVDAEGPKTKTDNVFPKQGLITLFLTPGGCINYCSVFLIDI